MVRPRKKSKVRCFPRATRFKPAGIPARQMETVTLTAAELEALRLADQQSLYHSDAAELMDVSRATFGRTLATARKKVADALIAGKNLEIERPAASAAAPPHDSDPNAPSAAFTPSHEQGAAPAVRSQKHDTQRRSDMKIVITAKGNTLDAAVDPRFGRAAYFIVFDTENETFEVIDNSAAAGLGGGAGVQAGAAVTRHNPQAVITGHCGPKAFRTLQAASIEVFTGAKGTVAEAIADHKNGKLSAVNGPDVAGHW